MMVHMLDALDRGENIGHYGRLVFAMRYGGESSVVERPWDVERRSEITALVRTG